MVFIYAKVISHTYCDSGGSPMSVNALLGSDDGSREDMRYEKNWPHRIMIAQLSCAAMFIARVNKQNYKWRSAELKSRWEVVAQTRHAVIAKLLVIDLAYIRINKTPVYGIFLCLEKAQRYVSNCTCRKINWGDRNDAPISPFFSPYWTSIVLLDELVCRFLCKSCYLYLLRSYCTFSSTKANNSLLIYSVSNRICLTPKILKLCFTY